MSDLEAHIYKALITAVFSLSVAFIAAKLALASFFKQKEFELVRDRYLYDGVDKIRSYNVQMMVNYNWNYLQVNKCLAQAYHKEKSYDPVACLESLREIDGINVCGLEYTRVTRLLGDDALWELNDLVAGNIIAQNDWLRRIIETLKYSDSYAASALLKLKEEISVAQKEIHIQVGCITGFLTEITDILEETKLEFSSIKRFSEDITVSELTNNIRILWGTESQKYNKPSKQDSNT
jgi:hypothetical protein